MIPKFISQDRKQLVLFDMDGVVAEYTVGENMDIINEVPNVYFRKRPIMSVINSAEELSKLANITVGILSSCDHPSQIEEKKKWLKKYMPFIEEKNIWIVCWDLEKYIPKTRCYAKRDVIEKIEGYDEVFLVEDTHTNIEKTNERIPNCAHHVSEVIF